MVGSVDGCGCVRRPVASWVLTKGVGRVPLGRPFRSGWLLSGVLSLPRRVELASVREMYVIYRCMWSERRDGMRKSSRWGTE